MIADIYKVGPLTYPKIFQCDNGSEFKGEVTKMLEKQEVKFQRVTAKYKHTHTAFIEALNNILAERLFKVQDAKELNDPEKVSSRWVKHLYGLVDELNDTETEMIGMKPKDAIKLKEVPLVARESYPPEEVLPEDGLYRYLLQLGEAHNDQWHRATDRIWSKGTYRLREIVENPGNRVMYYASINLTSYHPPPGLTARPLIFSVKIGAPGTAFQCKTRSPGRKKRNKIPTPGHHLPSSNAKISMK